MSLHETTMSLHEANEMLRLFVLALAVWREARGESYHGKLLVAQTIENRVRDERWPETYESVILQPWQFSAFNKNDPNALRFPKENDAAWANSLGAAQSVLRTEQPFTKANHYHARAVTPYWADDSKIVDREGAHIFYEL